MSDVQAPPRWTYIVIFLGNLLAGINIVLLAAQNENGYSRLVVSLLLALGFCNLYFAGRSLGRVFPERP